MTIVAVTTRASAAKGLHPALAAPIADQRDTPIFRTFAELIEAVDAAIEMERDLSHSMSWDPASSGFVEAAENQWQDCLRLASDIFSAPTTSANDQPLQRMAMLMHFLIEAQNPDAALHFQRLMYEHRDLFTTSVPGVRQALRCPQANLISHVRRSAGCFYRRAGRLKPMLLEEAKNGYCS